MKRTICLFLLLALLLSACGGRTAQVPLPEPAPSQEPMPEPTPAPEAEDPLERALDYLRARDGNYTARHMNTYLELYRMTHPGANVFCSVESHSPRRVSLQLTGLDAPAFAESGYLPDLAKVVSLGKDFAFVPLNEPIPREPEFDRVSDRGLRITLDQAEWPTGTEFVRFTLRNEGKNRQTYGADLLLEKYVEGNWQSFRFTDNLAAIGYSLAPGAERIRYADVSRYPALGEGLYRVRFASHGDDWAEFAVRAEAESPDLRGWWRISSPEAALLLGGLPEGVESDLSRETPWPAMSSTWELQRDGEYSDAEVAAILLGEGAEYDPSAEVYRLGDGTLSLAQGARLERDSLLVQALRLALPLGDTDPADPRAITALEQAGWSYVYRESSVPPLDVLYPGKLWSCYTPDVDILNQRLETALAALGEEAGELRDFRFTQEEGEKLRLLLLPLYTPGDRGKSLNSAPIPLCSPYGELGAADWCVVRGGELLLLSAPYLGCTMVPGKERETLSPLVQAEKFLPLLQGEEGVKLTSFDYALLPRLRVKEGEDTTFSPVYRLRGVTESGEARTWVVSAVSGVPAAYDLPRRVYLQNLMDDHVVTNLFRACWERYPEMDVWPVSWGIQALEDGWEALVIECDGVDCPALETSGLLPDGVALKYPQEQFNQKKAHPCPWEPEWEKSWAGGTVTLTMVQAVYPLYPEAVEVTVRCEKAVSRGWLRFEKYAEGEWHNVRNWMSGTLEQNWVEAGENTLRVPTTAKLGEGLYRYYLNADYWVEFRVTAEAPGPSP